MHKALQGIYHDANAAELLWLGCCVFSLQTQHTCNASEKSDSCSGRILSTLTFAIAGPSSRTGPNAASLQSAVRSLAL